jgi:Ca2+-binding RTX toxin-like protein
MRSEGLASAVLIVPTLLLVTNGSPAEAAPACTIVGTPGDDVLVGTRRGDVICGGGGDDELVGRGGDDVLRGGAGRDKLVPGWGHNSVAGGDARDMVRYDSLTAGRVVVDLKARTVTGAVTDTLAGVEGVVGTARRDRLVGSRGADRIYGGPGADVILPGPGDDLAEPTRSATRT